jgi:ATP-binding cassette subfamily C (CFTR/MRP) protein 1
MDEKLDRAFRTRFKESTVIIITHNMEKTLACDKILVLDGGKLKEFDSPAVLLENKTSLFYAMVKDSGLIN